MSSETMQEKVALSVHRLGKKYRLRHHGQETLKTAALSLFGRRKSSKDFWALRDVSFEVLKGETLGVIGRNGAGKSTLLGLITGTITATEGKVETCGRISSLLELGAGFHPELTGRENVFLNGSILGLKRKEIEERFDDIVEFAELRDFIDEPVKHYSSGMFIRLGFSVAMEVEPDILIVDEVLSVGDERFQKKCRERIDAFKKLGRTLLIVSHSMDTIQNMCDRTLLLNKGELLALDSPSRAIHEYRNIGMYDEEGLKTGEWGSMEACITNVLFFNGGGRETKKFLSSDEIVVRIAYSTKGRIEEPVFGYCITAPDGRVIFGSNTQIDGFSLPFIENEGALEIVLSPPPFMRGKFFFTFSIHSQDHLTDYHRMENRFDISVSPATNEEGFVKLPAAWRRSDEEHP